MNKFLKYNLVLLGPPGSGKGSVAELLCEKYGFRTVSTGRLLRLEMASNSELGGIISKQYKKGKLVDENIVVDVLFNYLDKNNLHSSVILDGFPRSLGQAVTAYNKDSKFSVDLVIYLDVDYDALIFRISNRLVCEKCGKIYSKVIPEFLPKTPGVCDVDGSTLHQRPDDKKELVQERILEFEKMTLPLVDFYKEKNLLKTVDGNGPIHEVFDRVVALLESL